ncbi:MAG: VacJ family lipoprotein [Nitrospirota bacterium]|nr:VacJ family lipoprotein [Nitrospirota bacterium]
MKRYCFQWLVLLSFLILPALAYGEETVTKQEKSAPVTESPVEQKAVAEDERPSAASESLEGPAAETEPSAGEEEYEEIAEEKGIADPLEPWNRIMFTFNDKLYFWVLKPVAQGYSAIVPEWGRVRVKNVFHNITMPVRFVNNLLQLKIDEAGTEVIRFVLNSTAGVLGMFDVAKNIDLRAHDEDLGQTLGMYGFGDGFYLVWPVLGPSSLRDTAGTAGDFFLDPVNYITPAESGIAVRSLDVTNKTSLRIGDYEDLKESALDPYISLRNAYFQYRENKIKE